jgi:SAM-dependent methyltransferase
MPDFRQVTETVGAVCSREQLARAVSRYGWVRGFCWGKDVLEVACGTGQGLKMLMGVAKSLQACDISKEMVEEAKKHHPLLNNLFTSDETRLPVQDQSIDVVICFEAIYYFREIEVFLKETKRVLRKAGALFLCFPNSELFDFNPSPFAVKYFKPGELNQHLVENGFSGEFYGGTALDKIGLRQKIFRPLKGLAARLGLIPGSMRGKEVLKRIVFGNLHRMPTHLDFVPKLYDAPQKIEHLGYTPAFKVIFCKATI